MPKLSSTMETGTLLKWLKEEGDTVTIGEPLFEIMTDKINIEVESYDDGILLKKYYDVDEQIPVNQVIGYIGNAVEKLPEYPPSNEEEGKVPQPDNVLVQQSMLGKVRATPAARKRARTLGFDITTIEGSGPRGRIHVQDVLQKKQVITQNNEVDAQENGPNGEMLKCDVAKIGQVLSVKKEKLVGVRKVIAERMSLSAFTAPHVTVTSEIDMSKSIEIRKQLLPIIEKETGFRLSYTEIIIKSVAKALEQFPLLNASLINDEIIYNDEVNIGLAVALNGALVVPVIKNVNTLGLLNLTVITKNIGLKARGNKLSIDELKGSTFTVSNLGAYAIDAFTPIINPPETAILGVGRIQEKPVVVEGKIEIRSMIVLSLSFDHRVIDGAPAAEFLTKIKEVLENPYELLM